jgi:ketosteroid isomerase-like protein
MTTPDYTFVNQNGVVQKKEQRLAPIKSGNLKYESVKYEEVEVHIYGDAAVVTARVDVKGSNRGADISGQFRSTIMLVKVKGRWLMAASQANVIPQG